MGNYLALLVGRCMLILLQSAYHLFHRRILACVSVCTFLILYPFLIAWTITGTVWFVGIVRAGEKECVSSSQMPEAERTWLVVMWLAVSYVLVTVISISVCAVTIHTLRERHYEHQLLASGLILPLQPSNRVFHPDELPLLDRHVTAYRATGTSDMCSICYESIEDTQRVVRLPGCSHMFHYHCIREWLVIKAVCPCCKGDVLEALGLAP